MPIQRQSDQFSVFDTGTRWERDRPQHDLPRGLAGLVNGMGPRITGGMLNTRQAGEKLDSGPWTEDDWRRAEAHDPTDEYRGHPDGWGHRPTERDYADWESRRRGPRTSGWHYPDRRDWTDHDPADDFYDDGRPSASELAEEDAERERERRERLEDEGYLRRVDDEDPDRFVPGSFVDPREAMLRRRLAGAEGEELRRFIDWCEENCHGVASRNEADRWLEARGLHGTPAGHAIEDYVDSQASYEGMGTPDDFDHPYYNDPPAVPPGREARRRTAGGYEDIYFPGLSDDIEPSPEYVQKLRQHGIKPVDANYMGRELMDQYGLERPTRLRNLRNRALRDGWKPENFEIAVMNRLERGKQAPGCPECESEGSQCVRHYNYGVNLTRGYLHEPGDNPFEQVEDEDGNVLYEPRYKTKNPVKRVVPPYVEPPADPNSPRGINDAAEGAEDEDEFRQLARLAAHARRLASRGSGRLPFDRQAGRRPDWRREWAPFSGIPYDPDRDDSREFAVGYRVRHRDNPDQLGHVKGIVLSKPKPGEQRKILISWDDGNEAFHPMDEINRAPRWEGDTKYGAKGKCECWEGYERVPGTEPCADGSCRKKKSALRRLTAQMSYEDAMKHIDDVLAEGEGHDLHHVPGADYFEPEGHTYYDHSDIFDHCRGCGGDGTDQDGGECEHCRGTGENQGSPYGDCDGCGEEYSVDDLEGEADLGMYCPDCLPSHKYANMPTGDLLDLLQHDVDNGDRGEPTEAWDELLNRRADPSREGYDPEAHRWLNRYRTSALDTADLVRLAGDGMSYEDAMAHIDEVLAGGENHDLHRFPGTEAEYARGARSSGAPGPHLLSVERHLVDEDYRDEQLDAGTHLLNPELAHEVHPSERQAIDRMHEVAQDWGCEVNEYDPDEDSPEPPQPDVRYFQFDGPEEGEVQGYAELRPHTGHHTAAAPVQDPAAMAPQMPAAGGYQPGHRVGLPWRDEVVRGTVIGLDGDQPAIRWDDGQYSTEETRNILPL